MCWNKLILLIIIAQQIFRLVLSSSVDTFIPGYNIDVNGLSIALTNQYYDNSQNLLLTCPDNCGACNDQNTCTSCKFGFFQWSPVFNNNLYCAHCPMFNPDQIQNIIPCADCIMNPLTWQNTKRCSYQFTRITEITTQNVIRYKNVSDSSTQQLYQVYANDQTGSLNIQVVEFPGGDKWCGYELLKQIVGLPCYNIQSQNPVDQSQTAVICRTGFVFNWSTSQCDQCPPNCNQCQSNTQCSVCSSGYTIGAKYQCVQCTVYIANCYNCFFQDSQGNNIIANLYLSDTFNDIQSLIAAGYIMRCSQCSQNPVYLIPSLDLTKCEDCSSINSCISCRYAAINQDDIIDHSRNPFLVEQSEMPNYGKYCLFCSDPYFVNYNGQCEICSDVNCEQCYYGSPSGSDSGYTLQLNFLYKQSQDNLILKCAFCIYSLNQAALMLDGTCKTDLSFLQAKDTNCGKWNQFKVLQSGASLDATYFQCVECLNGYGFDASKLPQNRQSLNRNKFQKKLIILYQKQRICDQYGTLMNVPYCTSFYYITVNSVPQAVSCIRCQSGFTASAARGCVSCSSGLVDQSTMDFQSQTTCSRCSLISPTGFNYTYYLITSQLNLNAAKTAQIEIQYNLPQIPLCISCGQTSVYGFCPVSCFYGCYQEQTYNACIQDPATFSSQCIACDNTQYGFWHLSQSLSLDSTQCIECQKYCGMCQQRTIPQMNLINPYFNAGYFYDLQKYANYCINCRTIADFCNDYSDPSNPPYKGYHLDCTNQSAYIMNYDPNINQCTPCLKADPSCTRTLKIQQLVECRPDIQAADLELGSDQNQYYLKKAKGTNDLNHIFTGVNVIFLDSWNPTTTLSINFQDFDNVDNNNLNTYLALNEENVSNIEFELLFIPYVQQYTTNDKVSNSANTCLFPNDVSFSLKIAEHIANIDTLFSGWNYFEFENINFHPMYSLKPAIPLKNMLLDFSNNQFSSQLFLSNINFISGYDILKQQTLLNSAKTIFCPVIDMYNINYIQLSNVQIQNFVYKKSVNLFRFKQELAYQTPIFIMNLNNLMINQCQFSNVDFIQLYFNTTTIIMSDITISNSILTNVNFINQLPGHNFAQSQHSLTLKNILYDNTQFSLTTILSAYNLLTFKVTSLTLNLMTSIQYNVNTALLITNIATISEMKILNGLSNKPSFQNLYFQNITLFQFPTSSYAKAAPSITLDQLTVQYITFQASNGFIMNLASYQNTYQVRGEVSVSNLSIQSCSGDDPQYYLFQFSSIRLVTFTQATVLDTTGLSLMYAEYSDQIVFSQGSITSAQQSIIPSTPLLNTVNGAVLTIKNLRSLLYMENYTFKNLQTIDRAFFSFIHDQRDPLLLAEKLYGTYYDFISKNANKYDQFDTKGTNTNVAFNTLTFDSITTFVQDSNIVSSLFYFNTNIQYRNLLVDVTANNIQIATLQETLFKSSSAFINQDSNPSSLILITLNLKNCNSNLQIQNGILFNGINFATESSVYDTANSDFTNSVSDQGGAIYLKTFSTTANVTIIQSTFKNLYTSFTTQGTGMGGAISIDGTTSLNLTIVGCTFDRLFSYKKGAVLDLTCGQAMCSVYFISNIISNVFAPTGSIFNVKFNKISQNLFFQKNTYSSSLTIADTISQYYYFLEQNTDLQQSLSQFYIIYIQGGNILFEENTFDQVDYLQGLLYVTGGMISFNKNTILNSNFKFTPLVYFYRLGVTQINTLTILNMNECSDCLSNGKLSFLTEYSLTSFDNFFLIESPSQSFSILSVDIQKVICTKCAQGILGIQSTTKPITIQGGDFKNNQSNKGCLFIGGNSVSALRILGSQQNPTDLKITLDSLIFQGNSANLGGGVYISYNNLQLQSVQLIQNTAIQGGGIYFLTSDSNPNTFILQQSIVSQNTAQIGGGIKIIGTFPQLTLGSAVSGNTATESGSDVTSYPTGLLVKTNKKYIPYNESQEAVVFNQWSPGVSTDQELFVYLTGTDGTIQKLDSGITATLTVSLNYQSSSQIPSSAKISGTTTVNYDSLIGGFYLNQVQFQQQPLSQLLAKLQSSIIKIPTFDKTGALVSINTNYHLPLIFNTRYCVVGEAFLTTSGQCFLCANNTYSIVKNSTACLGCPKVGVNSCPGGSVLKLDPDFWRPSVDNDQIEPCSNQYSNCAGGKGTGDQLCSEGHIGALCEVCDISARFWLESYSNSNQYSCGKCKDTSNNTLKMIGLTIYTLIAIFFSVKSTKALLDSYIIIFYFQKIGLIQKSAKQSTEFVGIIIKLFTTYLQLIVVITTFNLQLPPGLSDITVNVGDPVKQMSFSMDCGLYKISGKIPMTYFRLMWSQLMPLLYVTTYLLGHYLYQKVKKIKSRAVIAWIAFIYIYISMQPSIVKQNIQTISCRQVSGVLYIKANVSEQCYTSQHIAYLLLLILPTLIVWVILIPIFFFKKMYDGKDQLDKINMQYRFGFLYTEYKKTSYFWELVKVYQKTFITFFINIYDSYNTVKGVLVILVLVIYLRLQQQYQPYLEKRFNDLDFQLNLTVVASIIISMFILDNPFAYLIWFGYIIMVVINTIIITKLIRILISGYTYKFEAQIGDKIVKFSIRFPKIAKYLNLPQVPQERVKSLWNKFRTYVKFTFIKPKSQKEKKEQPEANDQKIVDYESKNQLIQNSVCNKNSSQKPNQEMNQVKIRQKQNLGTLEQIDQNFDTNLQIGTLKTGQNLETHLKFNRPASSKLIMQIQQTPNYFNSPIDNNQDDFNLLNEVALKLSSFCNVKCADINTYIPGYSLDINGLSISTTSQFYSLEINQFVNCPANCQSCDDLNSCTSCQYGYFQWSPVQNNNLYCIKCPLFDINDIQNNILCGDCVTNPLTWSATKICSYKFTRISSISNDIIRYQQQNLKQEYQLFQIFSSDSTSQNTQVIEFVGGRQWCGYEFMQPIPPSGCNFISNQNSVDASQTAVYCRVGFVFNQANLSCDPCPPNCDQCYSSQQCYLCSTGYTLGAQFLCVQCSSLIDNCLSCFFGDSNGNSIQSNQYLSGYYQSQQQLINSGFQMRCNQCSQYPNFLIPNLDLIQCIDCSSLSQCLGCRYATLSFGEVIDHSNNPFIVSQLEQNDYSLYCLLCQDLYFVNYNGKCEQCIDQNCELCYYGTSSGSDSTFTLQNNFPYTSQQGNLILKCASCVYNINQAALMLDGTCQTGLGFLITNDQNCANWSQWKSLPSGATLDASYFKCIECANGYGFNVGKTAQQRICDQPPSVMNVPFCLSFYYSIVNNIIQPITCIKCSQGYTASAQRGCVSCSSGIQASYTQSYYQATTCTGCSFITSTGFNYTYFLISTQLGTTAQKALQVEGQYNLPNQPFCFSCKNQKVYGTCPLSCFYGCYQDNNYNACITDPLSLTANCLACGNVLSYNWSLNQGISSDGNQCIQCQRYCQFCENRSKYQLSQINPYFETQGYYDLIRFQNKCITCRSIADICSDFNDPSQQYQGFKLDCSQQSNYIVYYDPSINQCTPCLKSQPSCNRVLKIQQLVECRPNIPGADINIGSDQNDYYQQRAGGGSNTLSHIFTGVDVVFLDNWSPTTPLNIDFKPFANLDYTNLNLYLALNEENVSQIEFEILFIPNVQNYQTSDGTSKQNANVCIFPNDVNFSLQLAQHIANIKILSLKFNTVNPQTGQIGQDPLDFFITSFSFQGWNQFTFQNINFYPTYSVKPTVQLKAMLLDFSNNLFASKLNMRDITFTSGYDQTKQQKLLKSTSTIFCPVIDTFNLYYIELDNIKINNFIYSSATSFLKFYQINKLQISIFKLIINNLVINLCQFTQANLIQLYYDTHTIQLQQITISNSAFTKSALFQQLPGHNFAQSQHSIQIINFILQNNQLTNSNIISAYNMLQFKITILTLQFTSNVQSDSISSLITSNQVNISQMQIISIQSPLQVKFTNIIIFSYPTSSPSSASPSIIIDQLTISDISFAGVNGIIMNLNSYQNSYNVRGVVQLTNAKITNCIGDNPQNYLFYFNYIKSVSFNAIAVQDYLGLSFMYAQQTDQISLTQGSVLNTQYPYSCQMDSNINSVPLPQNQYHGTIFYIKNLRTRLYVSNWQFQYQCIIDRALFWFQHDQRDPTLLPEPLTDNIAQFISQNANQYDQLDVKSQTAVVFNQCTFSDMNTYVVDSNIVSSLFYFNTNIRYRNLLVDVQAKNIRIFTYQYSLLQSSSAFINQDSNLSSLVLIRNTLKNCNSQPQIQNGILFNGQTFATVGSTYDQANQGQQQNIFYYYGGFLNLQAKQVLIDSSSFSNSVSDQGGAIYIKVFSSSSIVGILSTQFHDISTSMNPYSTGEGGAIFIDGTTSITLSISHCTFNNIFAYKQGAVLQLTCGQATCSTSIMNNQISNVFAPSGSILNIKLNKQSQGLYFNQNTYTSSLQVKDMISAYNYFQNTNSDLQQVLQQFYIIYIQGGFIQMQQNNFQNINYLQGLAYVTGGILSFDSNTFSNSNFRFTPLVYIYKQQISSIADLKIQNLNECTDCEISNSDLIFLTNLTSTSFNNFFLVENPLTNFYILNIDVENVVCTKCLQGIIGIQSSSKTVDIQQGVFTTNKSNLGALYLGGIALTSSRMLNTAKSTAGTLFTLTGVTFKGNTAIQGGGLYISYNNLKLIQCDLQSNIAEQGGAIYFLTSDSNPNTLVLQKSTIKLNQAQYGGGIKIIGSNSFNKTQFHQHFLKQKKAFPQLQQNSVVSGNTASNSGNDVTSYPVGLKIYQNRTYKPYDNSQNAVVLNSWSPGVSTNQELFVYLTGKDGNIQKLDTGQTATLTVSLNYASPSSVPSSAQISGVSTVNYDAIIGGFYLRDVQFQQQPLSQIQVKMQSSIILIPIFDANGQLTSIDTSYNLPLIINMRDCIIGESFIATSGQCFLCANTTYSIVPNSTSCLDCPKIGVKSCPGGSVLNLEPGYWRPSKDSDLIQECSNQQSNCVGGKGVGDQLCQEGHIGALCEVCDISARFWLESYSNSNQFSCGKCKDTSNNTLKIVGLTFYTLIAILFSVKSTKALLDSYIITFYFQQIGFIQKSAKQSTESVGIIIKLFTTYLQLIVVITTFNLQLPPGISEITINVGDPVQQMSFSMDCGLYKISGNIPMTYFRLMWSQLMPLLYVISYLIGYFIYQKIRKVKSRAVIAWIAFIYIYISMQPSIVKQNIQTMSCRSISGMLFIKSNVSEQCYTGQHIKYILLLILPTLALWVFLIPLYLFRSMYKNKDKVICQYYNSYIQLSLTHSFIIYFLKLNKISMQYKFGFLYTEYKKNSYFWELVKVYQKTFITFFINIYDSYNIIKGLFVVLVLFIYLKLQIKYQPYLEKRFNDLDQNLNLTVMASIFISMFILSNPFAYLVWFGYIILFTINFTLVLKLIRILISGYTQKLEAKIGDKLVQFSIQYPKIARYFDIPKVPKDRVFYLWKVLRIYTKANILKQKNKTVKDILKKQVKEEEDFQSKNSLFGNQTSHQLQYSKLNNVESEQIHINKKLFSQMQQTPSLIPVTPQQQQNENLDDFNLGNNNNNNNNNDQEIKDNQVISSQNQNEQQQLVTQNEQKDFQIINLE
ncbi:hypothetical protein ABPG72_014279 [Tetrahymena utriculariae]